MGSASASEAFLLVLARDSRQSVTTREICDGRYVRAKKAASGSLYAGRNSRRSMVDRAGIGQGQEGGGISFA